MKNSKKSELKAVRAAKARKKKRVQKVIRAVIIVFELMILMSLGVAAYVIKTYDKVEKVEIKKEKVEIDEKVDLQLSGYTTIALFGCDSRDGELGKGTRTDTIMVAAIDNDTKKVRIISIYRDTLLQMVAGNYTKANAAYSLGGPEDAIAMLNKNLDLNITDYITVDFGAMSDAIDLMGGLKIKVTDAEANMINKYLNETAKAAGKKKEAIKLDGGGTYLMNGPQAVTYARLRKLEGGDYKRTERQRIVIKKMYKRLKKMSIAEMNNVINTVFPQVSTSIDLSYGLQLAACYQEYTLSSQSGFPFEKTDGIIVPGSGDCVVAYGLEENVKELHEFLYPGSLPELRKGVTVDQISNEATTESNSTDSTTEESTDSSDGNTTEAASADSQTDANGSTAAENNAPAIERYIPSETVVGISDAIKSQTGVYRPAQMHWTYYDELVEKKKKKAEKKAKAEAEAKAKEAAAAAKAEKNSTQQ